MHKYLFNFKSQIFINESLDTVFHFFKKAENLQSLTPPWLKFKILTPMPIEMKKGTLIDYQSLLYIIPVYWKTEITVWEPPYRFVDRQLKGPYKMWIHEHIFKEKDGGCLVTDRVTYQIPGGIFAPIINKLFVNRDIMRIFKFRGKKILEYFPPGQNST